MKKATVTVTFDDGRTVSVLKATDRRLIVSGMTIARKACVMVLLHIESEV